MFDEDEIKELEINKLLNFDLEKNSILKEKLIRIIEYINQCKCPDDQIKKQVLEVLNDKMQQLINNEKNVDNVAGNIDNIDKIVFGNNETKIFLQNK